MNITYELPDRIDRDVIELQTAEIAKLREALQRFVDKGADLQDYAAQQPECDLLWAEHVNAAAALLEGTDD